MLIVVLLAMLDLSQSGWVVTTHYYGPHTQVHWDPSWTRPNPVWGKNI